MDTSCVYPFWISDHWEYVVLHYQHYRSALSFSSSSSSTTNSEAEIEATLPAVEMKDDGKAFSDEKHNITSSEEIANVTLPPSDLTMEDGVGFLKENRSYTIQPEEVRFISSTHK